MSRKLVALLVVVWMGWSGAVVARAEGFDLTLSVTASIGKDGFSLADSSVTAIVSTTMNGWKLSSSTTFSLAFALLEEKIKASGKVSDYNISDEVSLDFKNPVKNKLTVATKMGVWDFTSVTVMSVAMDLSKFELNGETLKVGTTTKDGVGLSSATTFNLAGFQKEVVTLSGTISGVSVSETTEVTQSGSFKSTWDMSTAVEGLSLSRHTVYTNDGFASDTLTVSGKYDKYDWSVSKTFGKKGWMSLDVDVSTKLDRFDLDGSFSWTPEGFGAASLTASTTFEGLGAPPKK